MPKGVAKRVAKLGGWRSFATPLSYGALLGYKVRACLYGYTGRNKGRACLYGYTGPPHFATLFAVSGLSIPTQRKSFVPVCMVIPQA